MMVWYECNTIGSIIRMHAWVDINDGVLYLLQFLYFMAVYKSYIYIFMELKTWLLMVRLLNCISGLLLISFQIWFVIELFCQNRTFFGVMLRIWAPLFLT